MAETSLNLLKYLASFGIIHISDYFQLVPFLADFLSLDMIPSTDL